MAKISFSFNFLKESIWVLWERGLKETLFGKYVGLGEQERKLLLWIKANPEAFHAQGGRSGVFVKRDLVHKGKGRVYLFPNTLGDAAHESIVLFDEDVVITPGPDLYLYLSTEPTIDHELGEYKDLGLLQGTKGGQAYLVKSSIAELKKFKSAVIWCKQFSVLFTYATLS